MFLTCHGHNVVARKESSLAVCWCWWISCVNASDNFRSSTMFHFPSDDFSCYITSTRDGMDYAEKRKPIFKLRSNKNLVAECFNNILVSDSRVSWKLKPPKSSHFKTFSYFIFSLLILTTSKKKNHSKEFYLLEGERSQTRPLLTFTP